MRKLTNGLKQYIWDVYERPVYTWDVYERTATSWQSTTTNEENLAGVTVYVPYTGGYYRGRYHSFSSTGKHSIDSNSRSEITSALTPTEMTGYLFATQPGYSGLDNIYDAPAFSGNIVKNTELQRFEITALEYAWGIAPLGYGKGEPTGTTVQSYIGTTYPVDGYDATTEKYYVRTTYTKTPTGQIVKSQYPTAYPSPGYDAETGYWYEKRAMS